MSITRIKTNGYKTGTKYDSFLGGNPVYVPPAFESIATATGTGSSGTITFSSIPQTYSSLQIRYIGRDTIGLNATSIRLMFNGSAAGTTDFACHLLYGNGSSAAAVGTASTEYIQFDSAVAGDYAGANTYSAGIIDIHDYASTSRNKTIRGFYGVDNNASNTSFRVSLGSGLWMKTDAITSLTLTSSGTAFTTGSTFALYGVKGA